MAQATAFKGRIVSSFKNCPLPFRTPLPKVIVEAKS